MESFLIRLVIGVLILVLFGYIVAAVKLAEPQARVLNLVVLIAVVLYICFGDYFVRTPVFSRPNERSARPLPPVNLRAQGRVASWERNDHKL